MLVTLTGKIEWSSCGYYSEIYQDHNGKFVLADYGIDRSPPSIDIFDLLEDAVTEMFRRT